MVIISFILITKMFDVAKKLSREILVPSLSGVKGLSSGFLMRSPYT